MISRRRPIAGVAVADRRRGLAVRRRGCPGQEWERRNESGGMSRAKKRQLSSGAGAGVSGPGGEVELAKFARRLP
jgi:hypothetical protein